MNVAWHAAIAWALTGEPMDLGVQEAPDVDALVAQLVVRGWDAERMSAHARETSAAGNWPHPVPDAVRSGLGAAQLYAAVGSARERYGLTVLTLLPPSRRTSLDVDERRLLADRPPHYGG